MFSAKGLHRFNHGRADNDVAPLGPDCRPEDADQSRRTDRPQGCAIKYVRQRDGQVNVTLGQF